MKNEHICYGLKNTNCFITNKNGNNGHDGIWYLFQRDYDYWLLDSYNRLICTVKYCPFCGKEL